MTVAQSLAREELAALASEVASFYLRDAKIVREQRAFEAMLAREGDLDPDAVERYLRAVKTYFSGFKTEAVRHLATIDKRLEALAQLQFNATAERGVAARRVEITTNVLARLDRLPSA